MIEVFALLSLFAFVVWMSSNDEAGFIITALTAAMLLVFICSVVVSMASMSV